MSRRRRTRVRGVLLDSGDTMIGPIGGRWNPRFDFEDVLLRHVPSARASEFPPAFAAGARFLNDSETTPPRDEYHRVILRELGISDPAPELLAELDAPLDRPSVEPFPDVREGLERLQSLGVRMAVVSDSWPGLDQMYERLGLAQFFGTFVISAVLGCNKPDPRMYRAGSEGLGLEPAECVFVDDDPLLVRAAMDLGYGGLAIDRYGRDRTADVEWIADFHELLAWVTAEA